jgi:hypothetical protein
MDPLHKDSLKLDVVTSEARISNWLQSVLGTEVRTNLRERASRIVEEAIELAQVEGVDKEQVQRIVERVYSRPVGVASQEIAGIQVCVLAYTDAADIDLAKVTNDEITRIEDPALIEKIRAKHAAKAAAGTAIPAEPTEKPLRVIKNVLVLHLDDVPDEQGETFDAKGLCFAPEVYVSKKAGSESLNDIIGCAKLYIGAGGHLYADITVYPFVKGAATAYPSVAGAALARNGPTITHSVIRSLALTAARNSDKRIEPIIIPEA